jgi:hypothetical protein
MAELPTLHESLKRRLCADGFRTVETLDRCPKERLLALGYSDKTVKQIRAALSAHRNFVEDIGATFDAEGLEARRVKEFWPFDLLELPLTCAELGYVLLWQRDVAGRYGDKDLFCVAGGRVYFCTNCPYRDTRSNFCGFCTKKLLDDVKEGKRNGL